MAWDADLDAASPAYQIASSDDSRLRVVAGPGTGKSFAMKRRVARLLESGVDPTRILAVTFTRVAAEDLHRELVSLSVDGADKLNGRTLHSLAMSILMRQYVFEALGRTPRPLNKFELEPLLADLDSDHGDKRARRRLIDEYVAAWARLQHGDPGNPPSKEERRFVEDLRDWLVFHKAMLIGEVIPYVHDYLVANPGVSEHSEYDHVLIDEYQDLNKVEQETLRLLGESGSVCVIGDDDQSIYSFKYAHPAGIREWSDENDATDYEILECRRCPVDVVRVANSLISHNVDREEREIAERPENGPGEIVIGQYLDAEQEAAAIADKICALIDGGVSPGDIVVLAQRDAFARPIYERLLEHEVPAKSYYAETELDSREAQERFAILKLFLVREDRVALRWLLGCRHGEWHRRGYARVLAHCRTSTVSPWEALSAMASGDLTIPHTTTLVERFQAIRDELEALEGCGDELGEFVEAWLNEEETPLLAETVAAHGEQATTVEELFEAIYDAITQPEVPLEITDVRVMSFHKSKGLSAPYVFIAGCVEGLIPGRASADVTHEERQAKLEEDRRLLYVGITRVKANPDIGQVGYLALTYPQMMPLADAMRSQIAPTSTNFGIANLQASRFIMELGEAAPTPSAQVPL